MIATESGSKSHYAHQDHLAYRPEIDGLRAIAVGAVVLCHAGMPGFAGGYIGVDIFFVISGFLITRLLLADHAQGCWSLIAFYDRRVRRLVPTLMLVLAVSAAVAAWMMLPFELARFGGMLASAALFGANIYAWRTTGYFEPEAIDQPLLHSWSLGVEEQYYLLYPLLLFGVLRIGGARLLPWLFLAGAAGSLTLSEYLVLRPSTAGFYLLPPRGFELLAGGILALPGMAPRHRDIAAAAGSAGFALISYAICFYGPHIAFPGVNAVLPVVGSALLIYSVNGQRTIISRILSTRALVGVGLISYSLYLWHWPILSFASLWIGRGLTLLQSSIAIGIAFALSALSWRYVEQPLRQSSALGTSGKRFAWTALALISLAGLGLWMWVSGGIPARVRPEALAIERQARRADTLLPPCRKGVIAAVPDLCGYSAIGKPRGSVILWGDSHAGHFHAAVAKVLTPEGYDVAILTSPSCPPLLDTPLEIVTDHSLIGARCMAFNHRVPSILATIRDLRLVILAARWTRFLPADERGEAADRWLKGQDGQPIKPEEMLLAFEGGLERTAHSATDHGIPVLLVDQAPTFGRSPTHCVGRAVNLGRSPSACASPEDIIPEQRLAMRRIMDRIDRRDPLVTVFHPSDALCRGDLCRPVDGGRLLFFDHHHLSIEGAKFYSNRLYDPLMTALRRERE